MWLYWNELRHHCWFGFTILRTRSKRNKQIKSGHWPKPKLWQIYWQMTAPHMHWPVCVPLWCRPSWRAGSPLNRSQGSTCSTGALAGKQNHHQSTNNQQRSLSQQGACTKSLRQMAYVSCVTRIILDACIQCLTIIPVHAYIASTGGRSEHQTRNPGNVNVILYKLSQPKWVFNKKKEVVLNETISLYCCRKQDLWACSAILRTLQDSCKTLPTPYLLLNWETSDFTIQGSHLMGISIC